MVKLSKQAWRVFERNMNKSWGLLKLQFYAEDLIKTGGKESIGKISQFLGDLMSFFGMGDYTSFEDMLEKEVVPVLERELIPKIQASLDGISEKELEAKGKKWLAENAELFETLKKDFGQLMLAIENVLLEQALVTAVTAFEVYIRDVTEEVVAKNVFMQKRFDAELKCKLNYKAILESKRDLGLAAGRVAADSYDFNNSGNLKNHVTKLVGKNNPLKTKNDLKEFGKVLEYRHLIVHRAGIIDKVFAKNTGYKGPLGKPVKLSRSYVESVLVKLSDLTTKIQAAIVLQKATS